MSQNTLFTTDSLQKSKDEIINRFNKKVKGRKATILKYNLKHSGKEGHWLEEQMGIKHNASNAPDIFGFEMKKSTNSKTTFGDWSADYYIFKDKKYNITRDNFLQIFGRSNSKKSNRYSWSGIPCPKLVNKFNGYGQTITVDVYDNIYAVYNYDQDKRKDKMSIVPPQMMTSNLVLAKWENSTLRSRVEDKFNKNGWFQCIKNKDGIYTSILFGPPITFDLWIKGVKSGEIFFDSGMYQGNSRNYSQWRAYNTFWSSLLYK